MPSRRAHTKLRDQFAAACAERDALQLKVSRLELELHAAEVAAELLNEQLKEAEASLADARRPRPAPPGARGRESDRRALLQLADRLVFLQEQNDLLSRELVDAAGTLAVPHRPGHEPGVVS
ncbi:hypothetical protein [Streptomyces sp. NPDC051173]|uniref:hypothetical protein n=1 Tax=Streptomyces sp. NPDC051173 TaxID=3155164 RepID=UPI003450A9EA